jgi:hypothetical protein
MDTPVLIPEEVQTFIRQYLTVDPLEYVQRQLPGLGGLSAIEWVRSGHSWSEFMDAFKENFDGEPP